MEPKLTLRIANSDLLPVQGRYAELLNAPDMDGVLTAWRGDTAIALLVLLSGNERVEGAAACTLPGSMLTGPEPYRTSGKLSLEPLSFFPLPTNAFVSARKVQETASSGI